MSDIQLRFNRDMLVLSTSIKPLLQRNGVDIEHDLEFINLIEPDSIRDIYRLQMASGAQCLVANTAGLTPARLLHHQLEELGTELAIAACVVAREARPQHILAEILPCGLPMDEDSASSLKEHCNQYTRTVRFFEGQGHKPDSLMESLDAYFLNDFTNASELKCALIGMRKVTAKPIFASIKVNEQGLCPDNRTTIEEAAAICEEYEADVFGISTTADIETTQKLARLACSSCTLPILVQLEVQEVNERQGLLTTTNPYYCADMMVQAASALRAEGVQFLRATGSATPAYAAVLTATTEGFDVIRQPQL